MAAGAILVLRPVLPAVRPFKTGAICLFLALVLAFAAGTLGLGPGGGRSLWEAEWIKPRGGLAGEGLYYVTSTSWARSAPTRSRSSCSPPRCCCSPARRWPASSSPPATRSPRPRARCARRSRRAAPPPRSCPCWSRARRRASPPSRARSPRTRRRCPTCSATPRTSSRPSRTGATRSRSSRELAEDPEDDEPGVARTTPDPEDLTPRAATAHGHRLARVRVDAARPRASSSARPATPDKPDTVGQERIAAQLTEALGHFGIEAKVIGMVAGPAHHALRAAARPGHQGRQGRPAQGRPRLRARRLRHPHPRPDPRQAGGRRRGPQRAPADRPPRRRAAGDARGLVAAHRLAGQGRRGPRDRRRPRQDAAPARGGHHRRRQVGLRQRDARLRAHPRDARTSCGSCSSTPSRSSSTTTTRSRTCSRR